MSEIRQLYENEHIKNIIEIMRTNKVSATDFLAVLRYAEAIEHQLNATAQELANMRRELSELSDIRRRPINAAMNNTIDTVKQMLIKAQEQLTRIKQGIINGAKQLLAAIRDKGVIALDSCMSYLNVMSGLNNLSKTLNEAMSKLDRLEKSAQIKRETSPSMNSKPSMLDSLKRLREKAALTQADAPPIKAVRHEASI